VYVGPDGSLAPWLSGFNEYLEGISLFLREGRPAHRIACLLPLADVRMEGELPAELRKPSARYWWEFQHSLLPDDLKPWSPLWISDAFLAAAECLPDGGLRFGNMTVMALIVDSRYLAVPVLQQLARLSMRGARIVVAKRPQEPGRIGHRAYSRLVAALMSGDRTTFAEDPRDALRDVPPFLEGAGNLDFFVRERDGDFIVFVAHPAAGMIAYPLDYGAAERAVAEERRARFRGIGVLEVDLDLSFAKAGSAQCRIGKRGGRAQLKSDFEVAP
jgi:hypothetical protein